MTISAASLVLPLSLLLACGVCLLDDALCLIVVAAALAAAAFALGAFRLLAAVERGAARRPRPSAMRLSSGRRPAPRPRD